MWNYTNEDILILVNRQEITMNDVASQQYVSLCELTLDLFVLFRQILRVNKRSVGATTLEGIGQNGSVYMYGLVLTGSSYQQPGRSVQISKKIN